MSSTRTYELPIVVLSLHAHKRYVIPSLKSGALLSLDQLCDDAYIIIFHKFSIKIYKNNSIIPQDERDFSTGMWIVHISQSPTLLHNTPHTFPQLHHWIMNNLYVYLDQNLNFCYPPQKQCRRVEIKARYNQISPSFLFNIYLSNIHEGHQRRILLNIAWTYCYPDLHVLTQKRGNYPWSFQSNQKKCSYYERISSRPRYSTISK